MKTITLVLLISTNVQAGVFKCTLPDGKIKYQNSPCAEGERGPPLKLFVPPKNVSDKMRIESMRRDVDESWRKMEEQRAAADTRLRESNLRLQQELDDARSRRQTYYRERREIIEQDLEKLRHDRYCRESLHISPHDGCY